MRGAAAYAYDDFYDEYEDELEEEEAIPSSTRQWRLANSTVFETDHPQYYDEPEPRVWTGMRYEQNFNHRGGTKAALLSSRNTALYQTPRSSLLSSIPWSAFSILLNRKVIMVLVAAGLGWVMLSNLVGWATNALAGDTQVYISGSTGSIYTPNQLKQAASVASTGQGSSVLGSPTISPEKIDAVLRSYNSPATGIGNALYNLGTKYGIDPAYALAFFIKESSAGTAGVATVTKSIGNIRVTPGYDSYQGFRKYASWEEGAEDWFKLIKSLYVEGWKLTTVEAIIPVYAPAADRNNPTAYINGVNSLVAKWRANQF